MAHPILRATDAAGEVYDDPSEDALYMFMEDLRPGGSPLLVERVEEPRQTEWVKVAQKENGLNSFESDAHVHHTSSHRNVHELLTRWAFDLDAE